MGNGSATSERKQKEVKHDEFIHRVAHSSGCTLESPGKLKNEQSRLPLMPVQLDSLGLILVISVCLKALQV